MSEVYRKVVSDDGTESFELVNPAELELPEDHPLQVKYKKVTEETIARRNQIKALKTQLEQLEAEKPHEQENAISAPAEPENKAEPAPVLNPDEIVERAVSLLEQKQLEAQRQAAERKTAIDNIMRETGLSATLRPVIDAISDLAQAKAQAAYLAQQSVVFTEAASSGNGGRDVSSLLSSAEAKLGLTTSK